MDINLNKMKNFIKSNWFKIGILICAFIFAFSYFWYVSIVDERISDEYKTGIMLKLKK